MRGGGKRECRKSSTGLEQASRHSTAGTTRLSRHAQQAQHARQQEEVATHLPPA